MFELSFIVPSEAVTLFEFWYNWFLLASALFIIAFSFQMRERLKWFKWIKETQKINVQVERIRPTLKRRFNKLNIDDLET